MTNAELIAKIKTEIKRLFNRSCLKRNLARKNNYNYSEMAYGAEMDVCSQLLSFISDLEKSLHTKVKDNDELEKEILSWISAHIKGGEEGTWKELRDACTKWGSKIARHFYDLGCRITAEKFDELEYNRQRAEESISKDLEEASSKFATHTASNGVSVEFLEEKLSFQEGAKWDRQQIMKNAKDGWLDEECVIVLNDGTRVDLQPDYEKKPAFEFEYAQDVRVIVLPKEDGK